MSVKIEVDVSSLTAEEARALALFFLEVRNVDKSTLDEAADAGRTAMDAGSSRSDNPVSGEGNGTEAKGAGGRAEGQNGGAASRKVQKTSPVFVLQNKATGVQIECDSGRKGDVEAAKAHLETWVRDATSVEQVAGLAADNEAFVTQCFSKTEQRGFAKLVTEVKNSFAPDVQKAADAAKPGGETKPAGEPSVYTLDAVKTAGKALAAAKGLASVETVLAKFGVKSFKDLKEEQFAPTLKALTEAMS